MQNQSCNIISDLMPLYVDGVCTKETCEFIEEHISQCETCKNVFENMKTDLTIMNIEEENIEGSKVIKGVKKRIWIERIVIALIVLLVSGIVIFGITLKLTLSYKNMNNIIDFDDVYLEEDIEGNLWLVRSGNGAMASRIFPEIYDEEGNLMISSEKIINQLEDDEKYQVKVVFYESPLNYTIQKFFKEDLSMIEKEKSMLFSKEVLEKYNEIVIEKSDGTKKVLWERK